MNLKSLLSLSLTGTVATAASVFVNNGNFLAYQAKYSKSYTTTQEYETR